MTMVLSDRHTPPTAIGDHPHSGGEEDKTNNTAPPPPRVFLRYDAAVPKSERTQLDPVFERQRLVLSDTPVVTTTDKVLDCVLPPREYTDDETGTVMVQRVDHTQVSREQLHELHQVFLFKLQDAKARKEGICPVRQAIYRMLFDELLRQVTIDSPERGLLLLRIRDELRMTTDVYETLYDSAQNYSGRKMFEATRALPEMRLRLAELQRETATLEKERRRLEAKHAAMLRAAEEQQSADHKKYQEETIFLERVKQRLQGHLDAVKESQEAERRALRAEEEE